MNCSFWPSFDPKLTWDGLLTFITGILAFVAGLLAFFGIRSQIRHADAGLQTQLDAEKKARENAANEQRKAVATALLFEIDNHYRSNIRDIVRYLEEHRNDPDPTVIKSPGSNPFPVYAGSSKLLGVLPTVLVEIVVNYYGELRGYVATFNLYLKGYEIFLEGNTTIGRAVMRTLIPRIITEAVAITQLAYTTCGLLCEFMGAEFSFPRIGVAGDPRVEDSARATLVAAREQLMQEIGRMPTHAQAH
jgi:hypothetical protein